MEQMPRLLAGLVKLVKEKDGSDIHMLEGEVPRLRIRGDLRPIEIKDHPLVTREDIESILTYALTKDQIREFEENADIDFSISFEGASGRVNVGYANGRLMHFTMRYLSEHIIPMEELGIDIEMLKQLADTDSGLIIVAGETSSGKTTTIAAMLDYINHTRLGAISTIENPVEYTIQSDKCLITRREIGRDTPTFSQALRASVRKNPDVLLIGEIRDRESGQIAITAAETGILTFCTMHAIGAIPAISRLAHIMVGEDGEGREAEFYLRLSITLRGIIAQELVKTADGQSYIPIYEILNMTDIERHYLRHKEYDRLEQSLETDRSISLGECVYDLWQRDPRPIDAELIRRLFGSQYNQAMQMLKDGSGYRSISRWMG